MLEDTHLDGVDKAHEADQVDEGGCEEAVLVAFERSSQGPQCVAVVCVGDSEEEVASRKVHREDSGEFGREATMVGS